jgi:hypothetical protein
MGDIGTIIATRATSMVKANPGAMEFLEIVVPAELNTASYWGTGEELVQRFEVDEVWVGNISQIITPPVESTVSDPSEVSANIKVGTRTVTGSNGKPRTEDIYEQRTASLRYHKAIYTIEASGSFASVLRETGSAGFSKEFSYTASDEQRWTSFAGGNQEVYNKNKTDKTNVPTSAERLNRILVSVAKEIAEQIINQATEEKIKLVTSIYP